MVRGLRWIVLLSVAAGCGGPGADGPEGAPPPEVFALPDSRAGAQMNWFLNALNRDDFSRAVLVDHFAPSFFEALPVGPLESALHSLSEQMAPVELSGVAGQPVADRLVAIVVTREGDYYTFKLTTEASGLIAGLFYEPRPDLEPGPAPTWPGFEKRLAELPGTTRYLVAALEPECRVLHGKEAEQPNAVASAFKLFVLEALADAVARGEVDYAEQLAIDDRQKSLPTGVLQDRPAGEKLPLYEYAEKMIALSDNTATDHLLFALGRDAVEATYPGVEANHPLMSTREYFLLKLLDDSWRERFRAALGADRLAFFESLAEFDLWALAEERVRGWIEPRAIDLVGWFFSNQALCEVWSRLWQRFEAQPELAQILSKNTAKVFDGDDFGFVGFKGGSEPGVLQLSWLLERKRDGRWFVFSLTVNDAQAPVDEGAVLYRARIARTLLLLEP